MSFNDLIFTDTMVKAALAFQETTGTTADDIRGSYDGTIVNMGSNPNTITGPNAYLTSAFDFQDTNDHAVDIANFPDWSGLSEVFFACWVKLDTAGDGGSGRIWVLDDASGATMLISLSSGEFRFRINRSSEDSSGADLYNQGWEFVVVQKTSTQSIVYYNGATTTNSDSNTVETYGSSQLTIGNRDNHTRGMDGGMALPIFGTGILTAGERAELEDGPELNYVSGVSFDEDGVYDAGTWSLPSPFSSGSNGTPTYEVIAVKADGTVLDSDTTKTGTLDLSANAGVICYLLARVSNDGDYDIGDEATRTSNYGSAGDGYYEIASVTAASNAAFPFIRYYAGAGL